MKIRIFHMKETTENLDKKFLGYDTNKKVCSSNYKQVYGGDVPITNCSNALNEIYTLFTEENTRPAGYSNKCFRLLSVGDVIEMSDWNEYYYVDSFGFKKLERFDIRDTDNDDTTRIVICEPDRHPYVSEISAKHRLEALQHIVGGNLEAFKITDGITGWCNEEGRLTELPLNRIINGNPIYGTFFISGTDEKDISSLDPEQIDLMTSKLYYPAIREVREAY